MPSPDSSLLSHHPFLVPSTRPPPSSLLASEKRGRRLLHRPCTIPAWCLVPPARPPPSLSSALEKSGRWPLHRPHTILARSTLCHHSPPQRREGGSRCIIPAPSSAIPCHQSIRPPSLIQLARSTVPYPRFELKYLQKDSPTSVGDLLSSALVCVQICDYIPKKRSIACLGVCFF